MLCHKDKSSKMILYILKILILIFFLLLHKISFIKKKQNIQKDLSDINGNYRLYDYFKYPQISIIIPNIDNWALDNIFKFIMNLRNQTLKNIEIILTSTKNELKEYKKLENICLLDKRIKLKKIKRKESINNLFSLMNLLILYTIVKFLYYPKLYPLSFLLLFLLLVIIYS